MEVRLRNFTTATLVTTLALVCATAVGTAHAHQTSVSRSKVTLSDDKTTITYELSFDTRDMEEALEVRAGGKDAAAAKRAPTKANVFALLQDKIKVRTNGECKTELQSAENLEAKEATAVVVWTITCGAEILDLRVDYQLFFNIDKSHTSVLSPREGDRKLKPYLFKKDGEPYRWNATNWLLFVRFGMEHIAFGIDHVFFLLALLFVALLGRRDDGWYVRSVGESVKYTAWIVSSFTVAHSLTLIAAALGWFTLPSRFVESMIALSIMYVAVENMVYPHTRWRPAITFAFGLLHGMGFASSIAELLPPEQVVMPLLMFNVGVELGQLLIVLAVLPLFAVLARKIGPDNYKRWFVSIGSISVGLFGLMWFVQRAFGL